MKDYSNSIEPEADTDVQVLGVGFGPANIALAIALEEAGHLEGCQFLERNSEVSWQPEMMLRGADIQHNPLRDLVTPRNPTSPFGFLSYLKSVGRLYDYLNLDAPYPPRAEYDGYIKWVAKYFENSCRLNCSVDSIEPIFIDQELFGFRVHELDGSSVTTKSLVLAPGRTANVPKAFEGIYDPRVFHLSTYLRSIKRLAPDKVRRVMVVGASQSAAEIVIDLYERFPKAEIICTSRGYGFKQKDLSPFTEAIYYPSFVDEYFRHGRRERASIYDELKRSNYGAADPDVLSQIRYTMYEDKVRKTDRIRTKFSHLIEDVSVSDTHISAKFVSKSGAVSQEVADVVVLATGFENYGQFGCARDVHPLLDGLSEHFSRTSTAEVEITRDFRVGLDCQAAPGVSLFLNGLCEATHGFGDAGSFSLLATRSATIAQSIVTLKNASQRLECQE